MRFAMSTDEKKTPVDVPAFVISQPESSAPGAKSRKKYVIIGVSSLVVVALILAAILVGMHMFTEAEKEILQFSLQLNKNAKQDVTSNPNTNTVQYHVKDADQDTWIVNDYNADITVTKIQTKSQTNCYVTPLNESAPNNLPELQASGNQKTDGPGETLVYTTGGSPIKDTSFLSKTARDMCSGISIYWLYPHCEPLTKGTPTSTTAPSNSRDKRAVYAGWCSPCFYLQSYCIFSAYYYYTCVGYCHYVCVITYHPCTIYYSQYC